MVTHLTRAHWILIAVNAAYLVPLAVMLAARGDWEFLGYVSQVIALLVLLMATIKKTHFPVWLLALLSIWAALHMAGGAVTVGDGVLYAWQIVHIVGSGDAYVLKYDQVIHFYGFFVATFVAYWLLLPQLKSVWRPGSIAFVAMLAGMGFGAMNEIIEFIAVLTAPETGVGGYYNTAIDMVANALGALAAALIIAYSSVGRAFHTMLCEQRLTNTD